MNLTDMEFNQIIQELRGKHFFYIDKLLSDYPSTNSSVSMTKNYKRSKHNNLLAILDFFKLHLDVFAKYLSEFPNWIKFVRVVGGSAGTKISDMSNSSAEHSSVEPKSMQMKEINSTDYSLERSLAASIVEV